MFKNYMKVAFNNLGRRKIYSIINILGLAIGLTLVILILLFVQNELSYDRFHKNAENLYRVFTNFHEEDGSIERRSRGVTLPMGPEMEAYFPEIIHSIRLLKKSVTIKAEGKLYHETITMVDKPFFQVFSFPLLEGRPNSVFAQPNSVVLTEDYARKLFGDARPVGKTLTLIMGQNQDDFVITGISAKIPYNSSITFDILIDMDTGKALKMDRNFENWGAFGFLNYVLVKNKNSVGNLLQRFPSFTRQYYESIMEIERKIKKWKRKGQPFSFGLQKITRVHLDPAVQGSLNLSAIFILSGIAFIVLFIASINFMNLSIGQASTRSLEVGMRRILGANRGQLIRQFCGESLLVTGLALVVGIVLAAVTLPTFNRLANTQLDLGELFQPASILALLALMVIVGLASGSYPALVISRFQPVDIFRKKLKIGGKNFITRALVVVQFALSIFLIISTIIMGRQIHFLLTKDPGFSREGVMIIRSQEPDAEKSNNLLKLLRERLNQQKGILSITGCRFPFGDPAGVTFEKDGREINAFQNRVDYDYFKTLGIKVAQGRPFSPEFATDQQQGVVVTEKLVKELGIEYPIGKPLEGYYKPLIIIGVVKDYNIENFRYSATPVLHHMNPAWNIAYILVRIAPGNISETLSLVEDTWKDLRPNNAFRYSFLDEDLEAMYNDERRWGAIVEYSSVLAVLIACMGIFGLTSISVHRRTKEIGIRKVMGASVPQVIRMVTKEFLWLVGIANIIGWPIAYYVMRSQLDNYYYRISLGLQYFFLAGILSFVIAVGTIFFLAARAALANPVDALRYE